MAHPTRFEGVASTFGGQRAIYAASRGIVRSTNRKNRVLRAPATNDSCETSGADPEGSPFAFWPPFRRDRVLRVPDLNLHRCQGCLALHLAKQCQWLWPRTEIPISRAWMPTVGKLNAPKVWTHGWPGNLEGPLLPIACPHRLNPR
jgi:hypothetical protein